MACSLQVLEQFIERACSFGVLLTARRFIDSKRKNSLFWIVEKQSWYQDYSLFVNRKHKQLTKKLSNKPAKRDKESQKVRS